MALRFRLIALACALGLPLFAHAHTGPLAIHVSGWASGLAHPFLGPDHLLVMLAAGLWAGQLGGRARWQVPATFVALMTVGGVLAVLGMPAPAIESGILASLIVLGLLLASALHVPASVGASVVGLFALFHGAAHGLEMPQTGHPIAYTTGFIVATTLLHLAGLGIARWCRQRELCLAPRLAGTAVAGMGLLLSLG